MNRDDLDDDARDNDPTDNDQVPEEYQNVSEVEMEGFLADAIEAYAGDQGIPNVWTLCRARHNVHNAALAVIPSGCAAIQKVPPALVAVGAGGRGIIR